VDNPITREGFRAWLLEHEPDAIVGYTGLVNMCPLAWHLKSMFPWCQEISVGINVFLASAPGCPWIYQGKADQWILDYILDVDATGERYVPKPVTAMKALQLLDRVEALPDVDSLGNPLGVEFEIEEHELVVVEDEEAVLV
jgi:hypothetical protein